MFKNLSSFVYSFVAHKFSNPIWTAYAFAWMVCNWKSIAYFLLSKDEIGLRMGAIDLVYAGELWEVWVYPLFPTLIFLIVFPWLEVEYKKFISKYKKSLAVIVADEQEQYYKGMYSVAEEKGKVLRAEADNKELNDMVHELQKKEAELVGYQEQLSLHQELVTQDKELLEKMKTELKNLTKENYLLKQQKLLEDIRQLGNNNQAVSYNLSGGFMGGLGKGLASRAGLPAPAPPLLPEERFDTSSLDDAS